MISKIKLIILDLDGVLINSKLNMDYSWRQVKKKFSIKKNFSEYFKHIGYPFFEILNRLNIKKNQKDIFNCYNYFSVFHSNKIKLYKSVIPELNYHKKKNIKLAIVTSKNRKRTLLFLKKFKIPISNIVCASKGIKGKPNPNQINKALKNANVKRKNTVYVGDMPVDYLTAKNAKLKFVFVQYGYGKKEKRYKYRINDFKNLRKVCNIKNN